MFLKRVGLGGHALEQAMYHERVCSEMNMSCGWHILKEDVYYWKKCLTGKHVLLVGMPHRRKCITGGHVLQEDLSCWRACLTRGFVLLEGILHISMCHIGKHVLWENRFLLESFLIRRACLT